MSPTRTPIDPPHLDGYSFKKKLGSGGFADVFLYERSFPRQDVAIKVLDRQMPGTEGRDRFADEANAMASLSTHPFIVTIFHADVSPEAHPYLVMEYYPGANFAVRSRSERLSVAQVLRLGVQVASAVETAHRAGILHRDIKPANILTSAYGRPGLTDFGIAGSLEQGASTAEGLSIPWSPPEALDGLAATDGRSDIYSLAATLYSILDGRSPFERSDRSTSSIELIERIEQEPLPAFDRQDVPGSLYRALAQAMAKDPASRPTSAAEFARTLQSIEVEQRYDLTPLEVTQDVSSQGTEQPIDADAGSTRIKGPSVIDSQSRFSASTNTAGHGPTPRRVADPIVSAPFAVPKPPPKIPRTARAGGALGPGNRRPASATYHAEHTDVTDVTEAPAPLAPPVMPPTRSDRPRRTRLIVATVGALGFLLIVAVAAFLLIGDSGTVSAPSGVTWGPDGTQAKVVWSSAGDSSGDTYLVTYQGQTVAKYPGSPGCHTIDSGYVCLVPSEGTSPEPITVYRVSDGKTSPGSTATWSG